MAVLHSAFSHLTCPLQSVSRKSTRRWIHYHTYSRPLRFRLDLMFCHFHTAYVEMNKCKIALTYSSARYFIEVYVFYTESTLPVSSGWVIWILSAVLRPWQFFTEQLSEVHRVSIGSVNVQSVAILSIYALATLLIDWSRHCSWIFCFNIFLKVCRNWHVMVQNTACEQVQSHKNYIRWYK